MDLDPRGKGRDWREWEIYVGLLTAVILAFVVMAVPLWPSVEEAEVSLTPRACALLERAGARIERIGDEQACTVRVEYSGRASSTSLLRFEHEGREVDVRINRSEVLSVTYL